MYTKNKDGKSEGKAARKAQPTKTQKSPVGKQGNGSRGAGEEIRVSKTYKLFIGGAFPRTESGRFYPINDGQGRFLANVCRGSRKDFRNAVVAARQAQSPWQDRSAYNKSQILYRLAEMLQQKKSLFVEEMCAMGLGEAVAQREFATSVDLLVYYAGWCDKYIQVFSAVNPVATSHFNFSLPEPTGVVGILAPENSPLAGMVQAFAPAIAGGNTAVVLASQTLPLSAVTFAEVIATSDVPPGVVNILTGFRNELLPHFATHMDVDGLAVWGGSEEDRKQADTDSAGNVKRVRHYTVDEEVVGVAGVGVPALALKAIEYVIIYPFNSASLGSSGPLTWLLTRGGNFPDTGGHGKVRAMERELVHIARLRIKISPRIRWNRRGSRTRSHKHEPALASRTRGRHRTQNPVRWGQVEGATSPRLWAA